MKTVQIINGEAICNECFNKQPELERGGRAMLPAGWTPPNSPMLECETCKESGVSFEDEKHPNHTMM